MTLKGQTPPSTRKRQVAREAAYSGPFVREFTDAAAYIAGHTTAHVMAEIAGKPEAYRAAVIAALEARKARKAAERKADAA